MKIAIRLAVLLLVVAPLLAWFVVKPVRVVAPRWAGLTCQSQGVCVESPEQLAAATALYRDAVAFVDGQVGELEGHPVIVFCATEACADMFGLGARAAVTVGTMGTVIGPRAWKPYYVRHELIHHLQGQRFGVLHRMLMPSWLIEGMAYSLSQDPRVTLAAPWQQDRAQFNAWLGRVGLSRMWQEARGL